MSETPLQSAVGRPCLNRDFSNLCDLFKQSGVDLRSEIFDRLMLSSGDVANNDPVVLLDGGCGTGAAIEHAVRAFSMSAKRMGISREIKGIGVDLNPVVDIDDYILNTGSEVGFDSRLMSNIVSGDVSDLPVQSDSVDIYYSSNVSVYVDDMLKAFEEAYRILKSGGIAVVHVRKDAISIPGFDRVLELTPGASDLFEYIDVDREVGFVVCRKIPNAPEFKGFPFKFVKAIEPDESVRRTLDDRFAYFRVAVYVCINGS